MMKTPSFDREARLWSVVYASVLLLALAVLPGAMFVSYSAEGTREEKAVRQLLVTALKRGEAVFEASEQPFVPVKHAAELDALSSETADLRARANGFRHPRSQQARSEVSDDLLALEGFASAIAAQLRAQDIPDAVDEGEGGLQAQRDRLVELGIHSTTLHALSKVTAHVQRLVSQHDAAVYDARQLAGSADRIESVIALLTQRASVALAEKEPSDDTLSAIRRTASDFAELDSDPDYGVRACARAGATWSATCASFYYWEGRYNYYARANTQFGYYSAELDQCRRQRSNARGANRDAAAQCRALLAKVRSRANKVLNAKWGDPRQQKLDPNKL